MLRDIIDLDATYDGVVPAVVVPGGPPQRWTAAGNGDAPADAERPLPAARARPVADCAARSPASAAFPPAASALGRRRCSRAHRLQRGRCRGDGWRDRRHRGDGEDDDPEDIDDEEQNVSLAAMEMALLPQVLVTFEQIAHRPTSACTRCRCSGSTPFAAATRPKPTLEKRFVKLRRELAAAAAGRAPAQHCASRSWSASSTTSIAS